MATKTYITDPKCTTCGTVRPALAPESKGYTSPRCKACRLASEAKAIEAHRARTIEHAAQIAADPHSLAAQHARARITESRYQDLASLYVATDHTEG